MSSFKCPFSSASVDFYAQDGAHGIVIVVPGGGYTIKSPREMKPVADVFYKNGYSVAVLDYTTGENLGLLPVKELSWAVETIKEACGHELPVLVCGFSAGAHLAGTLGVHYKDLSLCRPDALILCYPVITAGEYAHAGSFARLGSGQPAGYFSLEQYVSADTPPVFIWHTETDTEVPVQNSLLFVAKLVEKHVPVEFHLYPEGPHGLSLATKEVEQPEKNRFADAHVATWMPLCLEWIQKYIGISKN